MSISVAITACRETKRGKGQWIVDCLKTVLQQPEVEEIVIVDDASDDWEPVKSTLPKDSRIKTFQNQTNIGVLENKLEAVRKCTGSWVQLWDSDDLMFEDRFKLVESLKPWDVNTLYANSFGRSRFDYRVGCGSHDTKSYTALSCHRVFACIFNTGNHFLHKQSFIDAIDSSKRWLPQIARPAEVSDLQWRKTYDGADSAFYNSTWLASGRQIRLVSGLEYEHRYHVSDSSAYSSSPQEKMLIPPTYFYNLVRSENPTLPELKGTAVRRGRHVLFDNVRIETLTYSAEVLA